MQKRDNGNPVEPPRTARHDRSIERKPGAAVLSFVRKPAEYSLLKPPFSASAVEAGLSHPVPLETFKGPVEAARAHARQIINEAAPGHIRIVEAWQQLADGQIQFTIRTLSRHNT